MNAWPLRCRQITKHGTHRPPRPQYPLQPLCTRPPARPQTHPPTGLVLRRLRPCHHDVAQHALGLQAVAHRDGLDHDRPERALCVDEGHLVQNSKSGCRDDDFGQ